MKFIPGKDAPDLPLSVIEAHESGNLILFCGAGVSCNAGLPLFDQLVENVCLSLGEVLERIYIGRRFKNDTERLEKLFELYTKMTENNSGAGQKRKVME